jgi:hypothetical protein
MENQLPNFPVPSQNYIAPNLTPVQTPGDAKISRFSLNKKWLLITLVIFLLVVLPVGAYILGKQQGEALKTATLANNMNSINITPSVPTATPTPTLAPIATNSGTLVATPAAAWQTYANLKYAYSIQYPANWYNSEFTEKTGSAFASSGIPNNSGSEEIKINAIAKISDSANLSFADYVQIAGVKEFGYSKLATIKPITTASGVSGYETTWTTQSSNGQVSMSLPITYFEIPSDKTVTIEVFLDKAVDSDIYNQMLSTFKFTQ